MRDYGTGSVYQRGKRWWIAVPLPNGRRSLEPGGLTKTEARDKLKERLLEVASGNVTPRAASRITVRELLSELALDLQRRGTKSLSYVSEMKPVVEAFGDDPISAITPARLKQYQQRKRALGKADATINRSLGVLRQAFNLAKREGRITAVPFFPMLPERNARRGFITRAELDKVRACMTPALGDAWLFGFLTGWRRGEVLPLRWEQVDRRKLEVRLTDSKNGEGRVIPIVGELAELLERRWQARRYKLKRNDTPFVSPLVFHEKGKPLQDFRKRARTAFDAAGVPRRLFHDLRRSFCKDAVDAGGDIPTVMAITGHKTVATFLRYKIVEKGRMAEVLRRRDAAQAESATNLLHLGGEEPVGSSLTH